MIRLRLGGLVSAVVALSFGCQSLVGIDERSEAPSRIVHDGGAEPSAPHGCGVDVPFGKPVLVTELAVSDPAPNEYESGLHLANGGLTAYFASNRRNPGSLLSVPTSGDIFVTRRATTNEPFGVAEPLEGFAVPDVGEIRPTETENGKVLFFARWNLAGDRAIWRAERSDRDAPYGAPVRIDIPGVTAAGSPFVLPDGSALYFTAASAVDAGGKTPDLDLYRAAIVGGVVQTPEPLAQLNTVGTSPEFWDEGPVVSADERVIYFTATRPGGAQNDIWMATRADRADAFGPPKLVDSLSTTGLDYISWVSADNCTAYTYTTFSVASFRIYRAEKGR
jgi:hypothetical protein